jgi:hypothetical protein
MQMGAASELVHLCSFSRQIIAGRFPMPAKGSMNAT